MFSFKFLEEEETILLLEKKQKSFKFWVREYPTTTEAKYRNTVNKQLFLNNRFSLLNFYTSMKTQTCLDNVVNETNNITKRTNFMNIGNDIPIKKKKNIYLP